MPRPDQIPRKPEQMHVPGGKASAQKMDDPVFSIKETIRLQGMKWLQERGLQYESSSDDGNYLFLRSSRK